MDAGSHYSRWCPTGWMGSSAACGPDRARLATLQQRGPGAGSGSGGIQEARSGSGWSQEAGSGSGWSQEAGSASQRETSLRSTSSGPPVALTLPFET